MFVERNFTPFKCPCNSFMLTCWYVQSASSRKKRLAIFDKAACYYAHKSNSGDNVTKQKYAASDR